MLYKQSGKVRKVDSDGMGAILGTEISLSIGTFAERPK